MSIFVDTILCSCSSIALQNKKYVYIFAVYFIYSWDGMIAKINANNVQNCFKGLMRIFQTRLFYF